MIFPVPSQTAGLLFTWPTGINEPVLDWSHVSKVSDRIIEPCNWHMIILHSDKPLSNEMAESAVKFHYPYLMRASGNHAILVSIKSQLVESLLKHAGFFNLISSPRIYVDRLVSDLTEKPHGHYSMSRIYAKVDGYGQSLRSIAIYGDDLSDAELFRNMRSQLQPHRVELRDLRSYTRVLSVGSRGELSFYYTGPKSLDDVVEALRFLNQNNYIDWSI